jgi:hypothetical protein
VYEIADASLMSCVPDKAAMRKTVVNRIVKEVALTFTLMHFFLIGRSPPRLSHLSNPKRKQLVLLSSIFIIFGRYFIDSFAVTFYARAIYCLATTTLKE